MDVAAFNSLLRDKSLTIVCAESITAGLLASTIASVSGASDILIGSVVTYNRAFKTSILNVDPRIIDSDTAESQRTTTEMVYGLTKLFPNAGIYVAVTGVASQPTNNYEINKPVGKVYVSIYYKYTMHESETIINCKYNERNSIREETVKFILNSIKDIIISY